MPGPLPNARHERFIAEYLVDLDVLASAARAGVELRCIGAGYYVYALVDGRTRSIFYIGKGKGKRLSAHRSDAARYDSVNQVKAERIRACGEHLREYVLFDELDEVAAFRIEKELIHALSGYGLTNIVSGIVHPVEAEIARVDAGLAMIKSYDDWVSSARPAQLATAIELEGSTEKFYNSFLEEFAELRRDAVARLNSIKEKSHGRARR